MEELKRKLPFRVFGGDNLFDIKEDAGEPLVEGILYKNDFVQLIAEDKQGKSILCMQMAASLSSGTPFLGTYEVPEAVPIWYFSHEGKDAEMQGRLQRIQTLAPVNPDNFQLFCGSAFRWNEQGNEYVFEWLLETYKDNLPKVIFIDPLYAASVGDLNANAAMGDFIKAVRVMAEACDAAVFLVHHMKKNQRDSEGKHFTRSDGDGYGSAVFKWAVDSVLYLDTYNYAQGETYDKKNPDRYLRCNTQRSNKIADGIRMKLHQDDPLGFYIVDKHLEDQHKLVALLKNNKKGLTNDDMMKLSKIKKSTFFVVKKELLENGSIRWVADTKPKIFRLKEYI